MKLARRAVAGLALAGIAAGAVLAASHVDPAAEGAKNARQAHMKLNAHNLGILGNMAKGEMDYDAGAAQAAADNLVALSTIDQRTYWVPGTDSASMENTRLKAALFDNVDDARAKGQALTDAVAAMQASAGTGVDGIRAAIGDVGGACGACHKLYRESDS